MATKKVSLEYASLVYRVWLRFARTFVSGGLAAMTIQLAQAPSFSTFVELKPWLISLAVGFLAGGVSAVEKWSRE